jgi:hypothetical protein
MTSDQQKATTSFDYHVFRAADKRLARIVDIEEVSTGIMSSHKLYHIEVTVALLPPAVLPTYPRSEKLVIVRRYSDFQRLHNLLRENHREALLPALPSKLAVNKINQSDPNAVRNRADGLELYLNKILTNTRLSGADEFQAFFSSVS